MTVMNNENDFKYVLQDFSNIYVGMKLTYKELAEADDTPQRLKTAVYMYILQEVDENMRICDHLMSMDVKSRAYTVFEQLKGKFRIMLPVSVTDRKGNTRIQYREKIYTVSELVRGDEIRQQICADYISEYKFSKLHLASLSV